MTRYAQLSDNAVAFVIESEVQPDAQHGEWIPCGDAGPGWVYDGKTFSPPHPVAPAPRKGTHLWFRSKFTQAEQEWADELEATFESNPLLTAEQKRSLRTGYRNFNLATEVDLDDPRIPPMLGLYVELGGLGSDRPTEILA